MLFNSWLFGIFFALFFACYALTRRHLRLQNALILLASYVFYGAWDARFLVLIVISTATDYLAGLGAAGVPLKRRDLSQALIFLIAGSAVALATQGAENLWIAAWVAAFCLALLVLVAVAQRLGETARRKLFLWASVATNLGLLGVFKYFNFFADTLVALAGRFGIALGPAELQVVLPVGISFYTFQTMSYTIDAYRDRLPPTRNLLNLAAFVAFFPQLVAGPIERAAHLLPQIARPRQLSWQGVQSGALLFIWGLFKKIVIADNLARIADPIFSEPAAFGTADQLAALLAFTFQIYCDFSGYSDMARGLARSLGFDIMLNFNIPYIARTPSEFWERWHISLSSWLRDYLYIPLGGNRHGSVSTYRNLALTMLLGGLWHGANWTFVAWGAWHGAILVLYRVAGVDRFVRNTSLSPAASWVRDAVMALTLFALVTFGWLLFRASSFGDCVTMVSTWLSDFDLRSARFVEIAKLLWPLILVQWAQLHWRELEVFPRLPFILRFHAFLIIGFGLIFLAAQGGREFIYFDF